MGNTSVTQLVVEVLGPPLVSPDTSVTQVVVEVLGLPLVSPDASVTQLVVEVLGGTLLSECWTACIGSRFLFTEAEWEDQGVQQWFFEAFLKAVSGTVKARLFDATDGAEVLNSVVSTTSTSYVRARSVPLILVDGHEYCGQFGTQDGSTGRGIGFRVINI